MHNNSAFNLENNAAYEAWKAEKLDDYPKKAEQLIVKFDCVFMTRWIAVNSHSTREKTNLLCSHHYANKRL